MINVIEYIRNLFKPSTKRKRSTSELTEEASSPKLRKLSKYGPEVHDYKENWALPTSKFYSKTPQMDYSKIRKPIHMPTSVLNDDEPDFRSYNGTNPKQPLQKKAPISSTPNINTNSIRQNGTDTTNKFHKWKDTLASNSRSNLLRDKMDFSKLSNNSVYYTPKVSPRDSFFAIPPIRKLSGSNSTSDFTHRLDEKRKYQELLNKSQITSNAFDSFAEYYTPMARMPPTRSSRMIDLVKSSAFSVVDLTQGDVGQKEKNAQSLKTTTSETILKVLDDLDNDNDVVVIKDSDSDVEYLPPPPSPKPDFQVERVNSLKKLVSGSCEPLKENWFRNKIRRHKEELDEFTCELEARQVKLAEIKQINRDIANVQLDDQVKKCQHIKEVVIPCEIKQALPELTAKQEQMVEYAFDKRASMNAVLASKFSLNITRRDMLTLSGLNWLNDEVINFYMNLIIERGKLPKYPNAYAFNTFFYPKILKDGQQSVRRWTRKVDIFEHDVICVPIHMSMHWCMAIIDLRGKTVTYYDSMGKPNSQCTEALFKYLQDEHLDKKQGEFDTKGWKQKWPRDIPQQMNGSDCGMFSCTYAEFASRNAAFSFSQDDMPYLRRKMVVEIMSGQLLIQ